MKTKLIGILLLAGSSLFARSHVSVSVGFGPSYGYGYYSPAPVVVYAPPPPPVYYAPPTYVRPGYSWVNGYWYPAGHPIGWAQSFTHQAIHMLGAVAGHHKIAPLGATFEDGYRCAEVVDTILRAAGSGRIETVSYRDR